MLKFELIKDITILSYWQHYLSLWLLYPKCCQRSNFRKIFIDKVDCVFERQKFLLHVPCRWSFFYDMTNLLVLFSLSYFCTFVFFAWQLAWLTIFSWVAFCCMRSYICLISIHYVVFLVTGIHFRSLTKRT